MSHQINPRLLKSEPMRRCQLGECRAACCLHGVWLDREEWEDIQAHADLIIPYMPPGWEQVELWVDGEEEDDEFARSQRVIHSRVLPDPDHYGRSACVFLRSDHKCALQVAGVKAGCHPWRFKPFYCVLHPLDLDENGAITLDDTAALLDEPGSCLRPDPAPAPLLKTFEPELRYLLGDGEYDRMLG
jgi:hypothetical protein